MGDSVFSYSWISGLSSRPRHWTRTMYALCVGYKIMSFLALTPGSASLLSSYFVCGGRAVLKSISIVESSTFPVPEITSAKAEVGRGKVLTTRWERCVVHDLRDPQRISALIQRH